MDKEVLVEIDGGSWGAILLPWSVFVVEAGGRGRFTF